jgi:uncharacterized protein (TIGR03032 family)
MTNTASPTRAQGAAGPAGFSSEHTASFPPLLAQLGVSVAVSTYQAGRLIFLRADGDQVNTHFRAFPSPMGIAVAPGRLSLGTKTGVVDHRDLPTVGPRTEFPDRTDAVYVPRSLHVTGDIQVHEVWYDQTGTTWVVNTLFSCLATLESDSSFTPQWRPPFVTALAPEDRCHLNGVATLDGQARYVTALGATNSQEDWRANKLNGGVLLDVPSGEIIAHGLSMPHSPRLHGGHLWVLQSGHGGVGTVDPATGTVTEITRLPGFTRGLAFAGPYAFVGLSQVRESVFAGLPIANQTNRDCGIWVLDVRTGAIVAFLRFDGIVQEIFDIQLLPHRWPDLLELNDPLINNTYLLPDESLTDVPERLRRQPGQ